MSCITVSSSTKETIIKSPFPSIIGSSDASRDNSVLCHQMWLSSNLVSVSKLVDIYFAMLQQFSKPEILNSAEFSNSLVCVIDMFHSFGNQMNAFEYQSIHLVTIY